MHRRTIIGGVASLAASSFALKSFAAEQWPSRPIRLVVASGAGGSSDAFARLIATELGKALGQSVIVENKPGANGRIGTETVLNALADGQTLLLSFASAIAAIPALYPHDKTDVAKLAPIARFGSQGALLIVSSDVPVRTAAEFVSWVKASPTPVSYATYGVGSGAHIVMETLSKLAQIKLNHVPYKESARLMSDVRGGVISVAATDAVTPIPFMLQGKIRAFGVNGRYRLPATPDVPTLAEQGYPINLESWYGVFAPNGTPRPIIDRLNNEIGKIVGSPATQERFKQLNLASTPSLSPEEFSQYIQQERRNWSRVINENNIHPE